MNDKYLKIAGAGIILIILGALLRVPYNSEIYIRRDFRENLFPIQSIYTMKYSRDLAREKARDKSFDKEIDRDPVRRGICPDALALGFLRQGAQSFRFFPRKFFRLGRMVQLSEDYPRGTPELARC